MNPSLPEVCEMLLSQEPLLFHVKHLLSVFFCPKKRPVFKNKNATLNPDPLNP